MRTALWLQAFSVALLITGCKYPYSTVNAVDDRAQLQFSNAPEGAVVLVDGSVAGPAAQFDGKDKILSMPRGTHHVEVRDGNRTLYSQDLFLGGDMTKTITLPE
jgi:hypothetical protein